VSPGDLERYAKKVDIQCSEEHSAFVLKKSGWNVGFQRLLVRSFFWCVALFFASQAFAGEKLLFSGFAFSGDYAHRTELYPYTSQIFAGNKRVLDDAFRSRLMARPVALEKVSLELGKIGSGTQLSVAFALNYEDVETQVLDGQYLVILRLYASILGFDRDSKSLVAAYPVRIKYSTVMNHPPTDAEKLKLFKSLYLERLSGKDGDSVNAFDEWLERFEKVEIKSKYSKYLRVTNVVVDEDAKKVLSEAKKNERAFKNQLAQALETAISYHNNVPVVPSSTGEAIGAKMAYRFSDGNSLDLKLPDPDYQVGFVVRGFRYKPVQDGNSKQDIYRVLATILIDQPDLNKQYLNEKIYNTNIVVVPAGTTLKIDNYATYYKTLIELVNELSRQFSKPDTSWMKEHVANGADAESAFEKTNELFKGLK